MQVKDIMTSSPACCQPSTPLPEVTRLMVEADCGCIPVLDDAGKPIGAVTDRDIACRLIAQDRNPLELAAQDCMTTPCVTVSQDASVDECCEVLEENQIRRAVVVDETGRCCGMVAQADLVRQAQDKAQEVVEAVSRRSESASNVRAH
jgi:CBS domain-containing protein